MKPSYAKRHWNLGKRPITVESFYVLLDSAYSDGVADTVKRERKRAARIVRKSFEDKRCWQTRLDERIVAKILDTTKRKSR
jgi:hypothetical protein